MYQTKKRHQSQKGWQDIVIIVLIGLLYVIPICFMIVNVINTIHNDEKEITTVRPPIAQSLPEGVPIQSIPEEEIIAYKEEYTKATVFAITASSALTEEAKKTVFEAENVSEEMRENEMATDVFPKDYPKLEIMSKGEEKESTQTNISVDNTLETQEIAYKGIEDLEQRDNLIQTIARVIYAEACGEPLLGKVAVGATIVNRLNSEYFPDTIEEVLEGQYARYEWVTDEHLAEIPECMEAAERALMGEDPLAEELGEPTVYFLNPETSVQKEVEFRKTKKNATIGHHMFSGLSLYW